MLTIEHRVRVLLDSVRQMTLRVDESFNADDSAENTLRYVTTLRGECDRLTELLPSAVDTSSLKRHASFLEYYLNRNEPQHCRRDLRDLLHRDIPLIEHGYSEWLLNGGYYDKEFAAKIGELLSDQHLDSAVRKGFVIFKERLVAKCGLPATVDGRDLVNLAFGKSGVLAGNMPEPDRESMRNLLDGLFGMFRNTYGHNDVDAEWHEAEAILAMLNWALRWLEKCPMPAPVTDSNT
ncbi:MAG: hypothetical protein HYX51_10860 [Chloroflexi bacterium]|nr:hypothetical protein [Chloroflexota bacterium]